jgi:hypothetical protein
LNRGIAVQKLNLLIEGCFYRSFSLKYKIIPPETLFYNIEGGMGGKNREKDEKLVEVDFSTFAD